jgi:hypothetical protein
METPTLNLQALISETAALNCTDLFPLETVPFVLPEQESFRLLGRLLSLNPPSVYWVRDVLTHAWKFALPFEIDVRPADRFMFTVHDPSLVIKIMDSGPWNVKGALLVLQPWPQDLTYDEVNLNSCVFWVQVHGLPLQNMTTVNAIKIGKFIGTVLDVENGELPGIICNHHLRIKVSIDITQPLVPGFLLPRQGRSSIWIKFLYERLADYCSLCGLIGHRKNFFPVPPPLGQPNRYGFSLRGYVYPGSRISSTTPQDLHVPATAMIIATSAPGSSGLISPSADDPSVTMEASRSVASPFPSQLVTVAAHVPPRDSDSSIGKLPDEAIATVQYPYKHLQHPHLPKHGSGLATPSSLAPFDTCDKGKAKISELSPGPPAGSYLDPAWLSANRLSPGPPLFRGPTALLATTYPTQVSLPYTSFPLSPLHSPSTPHSSYHSPSDHTLSPVSPPGFPHPPPPPFQIAPPYINSPVHPSYATFTHKSPSSIYPSLRHHPYPPKSQIPTVHGEDPVSLIHIPSAAAISGHKRLVVSEASDLFTPPLKKRSSPRILQNRLEMAAMSLKSMKDSSLNIPTTIPMAAALHSPVVRGLVFTNPVDLSVSPLDSLTTGDNPPLVAKKGFKPTKKSRSLTQLVLVDDSVHPTYITATTTEAASVAMPPPSP